MTFLQPLALFGLVAAVIPILLHLLQRRTPPELEFPPVRWLEDAERRSARALRLRHLLLLLLRTALIVAVVLAAARPVAPLRAAGAAHPPTALALVLDNSPSAGAVGGGRTALERLRIAARTTVARASPDDRLFLLLADGVVRAGTRAELLAVVDATRPAAVRLDLPAAVTRAARAVDGEPLALREVEVFSDLQRTALADGQAAVPAGVVVRVLAPGEAVPPNRGVAAAVVRDGAVAVTVAGTPGADPAPLQLSLGGREVARALAGPGETVVLPLPVLPPGWWSGEVRLPPDELRVDDVRPVVVRVAPPAAVTVGPDAGPFIGAALTVLREAGRVTAGGGVRVGDPRPVAPAVVLPPQDPALLGAVNRTLAAAALGWRFAGPGTPGPVVSDLPGLDGVAVGRRLRLEGSGGAILARVNGEPWLVRRDGVVLLGSRLDTAWTALPTAPGFVPFVDQLVNRVVRGEATVGTVEGPAGLSFTLQGGDTVGATVAAPDPRESDLTAATPEETARALSAAPLPDAAFAAARFGGTQQADLSTLLLALALLCAGGEMLVAARAR